MQRSFGIQISGNRRPGAELPEVARARIIAVSEAGVPNPEIAADYRVNRSTVYDNMRIVSPLTKILTRGYKQ
jgi:hypothetical protein